MSHPADRPYESGRGRRPHGSTGATHGPAGVPHVPPGANPPPSRTYGPPGWRRPYPGPPVPPPGPPPVPLVPQPPPIPIPSQDTTRGVLWAFVPFVTLGYGTPFSFFYAAVRRGSWGLGATAAGYAAGTASVVTLLQFGNPVLAVLGIFFGTLLWIAGTGHAFAVRSSVFPREAPPNRRNQHAIEVAKYRRSLREEARTLAAEDPALAHELRIGRPDMPRTYDDGGLVDVNHAPPEIIAALPGMTTEIMERIVGRREEQGGFVSAEEMAVDADIPPDVLPQMADFTIFLH